MTEQWRRIPGFPDYEVSDLGRVMSFRRRTPRLLRGTPSLPGEYRVYGLQNPHGETVLVRAHRLVLSAFVGPCPDGMEGCHNDGNPANNRLDNVRWDSKSANQRDAVAHGTHIHARKDRCPQGHAYNEANTYLDPANGKRKCRTCRQEQNARYAARRALRAAGIAA